MNALRKYVPFFSSAFLMCIVLLLIYPHYQYYVDPDGTAYLTISRRYASGDYATAVNGYWSPWSCWLTAVLIKAGLAAIPASIIVNAMGGIGFLYISQSFFLKFGIERSIQRLLNWTLGLFLCYAVFWQSFADLWECFFLLCTLRIMVASRYESRPALWLLCGIAGALAYFSKAYSFPFFILNTWCCVYFICKGNKAQWLKISAVSIVVMMLCSIPWLIALHGKYGIWTTATSGTLNTSWYLTGHPQWKESIDLLIPPAYKDSPYYWEDPYLANGATPHFWNSWHLFGLQIVRIGLNLWKLLKSMLQVSVLFLFAANLYLRAVVGKNGTTPWEGMHIVALSFLLFPLGYLPVNFEARYIWYMLPLSMIIGGLFFQNIIKHTGRQDLKILLYIFALSFLAYPVWNMGKMYNEGRQDHEVAEQLKQLNIHGSFTSIVPSGTASQRIARIAYFSGNPYYSIPGQNADPKKVLMEMKRYHVQYYFAYGAGDITFANEQGFSFPEVTKGVIKGMKVFLVNP